MNDALTPFTRSTWVPQILERDDGFQASKFGGVPYLAEGESWPVCAHCARPLQFFLQVASDDLPEGFPHPWKGLLQLFYCTHECEYERDGFAPFAASHLVRIIQPMGACSSPQQSPAEDPFEPKQIIGWTRTDEWPQPQELIALGLALTPEEVQALEKEGRMPLDGDKLGGWPHWIQGVEYPACRQCGAGMHHLFQLDSDKNVPYMFGDVGIGHITQCPHHPDELAFGWACC